MDTAEIEALVKKHRNPTGLAHTPLPWQKALTSMPADDEGHAIADKDGVLLGFFRKQADRDLALYFVNVHAGMIAIIRDFAGTFEFLAAGTGDDAAKHFYMEQAEKARIYADLFARLGMPQGNGERHDER
jgi:hypothetical protein